MKGDNVITLLEDLIGADSRNPFTIEKIKGKYILGGNETVIKKILSDKLTEAGFMAKEQFVHEGTNGEKYFNLIAEKGKGKRSILFYGHMDTVSSSPWLSEKDALTPRTGEVTFQEKKRHAVFGLGSNDMKAGLAVMCTAFNDIKPEDYKIKVAFGVDEEFYSLGANVLAQSSFMKDVSAIVIPEIGDGPNKFYGHETIGIGRLGRCEFKIEVFGTGGHGAISNDKSFINAAVEASKFAAEFEKLRKSYKDTFVFNTDKVPDKEAAGTIEGSFFISKLDCGNESLSIPSKGRIVVDCTFTPNMTIKKLKKIIQDFIDGLYYRKILKPVKIEGISKKFILKLKDRPTPYSEAYLTPADHSYTGYVKDCVNKIGSFKNYNMGYSVADENVFKRYYSDVPVIVSGPVGWNSHRANEWVEIKSVQKLYELYKVLGENFGQYIKKSGN
jgi:acetylornithine deacetylase/succinyl-diaminopimelate desuccinylase-like protein